MIDIHCHILPAIDDGPQSMEEALLMCRMAVNDGISTIVATPHHSPGSNDWSGSQYLTCLTGLQKAVHAAGLNLMILPGAETIISPELPALLMMTNSSLTINNSIYFLVEFRPHAVPANTESFLQSLITTGLVPIIAHPERCASFMRQPAILSRLVSQGALLQLTSGSILGQFGPEVRNFSKQLITDSLTHVIASDAHDCCDRPPQLAEAVSLVADLVGTERARAMVTTNPAAIIAGRRLSLPPVNTIPPLLSPQRTSWLRRMLGATA